MKIDIFSHVMPRKYEQAMKGKAQAGQIVDAVGTRRSIGDFQKALWDMDFRFKIMDKYEGLVQVLTPTNLPLELIAAPGDAADLARIYNDEMAELVVKYPDRFVTAVACLPLNNISATLDEIDRAIKTLGFKGILMHTPVHYQSTQDRRSLDQDVFIPVYEKMVGYNLPIWIHPRRENTVPDYTSESRSLYAINHVFGWPFETSVAMTRLVFSGIMQRFPGLKIITHHCGAMIPYFADRIAGQYDYFDAAANTGFKKNLAKPPLDYYKMFYNDTALYGNTPALMCAYHFFGADHILFGTDFPFDVELGDKFTRDTIDAIDRMAIVESDKSRIFEGNARVIMGLD